MTIYRSLSRFITVLLSVACIQASCTGSEPGPYHPTDISYCGAACANLQKLGCPEGDPLVKIDEDGGVTITVSCEAFCTDIMTNGGVPLNPSCISTAVSCDDAHNRCGM